MEMQEMKTFVAVARFGSFSRAAEHLGYSQGAVTIQVRNLEEELGIRLLDRINKKITLTNRGKIFYDHAITILNECEKAKAAVLEESELSGELRIGTIDSLCLSSLPTRLDTFCKEYPRTRVSVITDTPYKLFELLSKNELDLVYLLDNRIDDPHLITLELQTVPVIFTAAAGHPLDDGKNHTLIELSAYPFLFTEPNASYRKNLDNELRNQNIPLMPAFETSSPSLILAMLKKGGYISFLPKFSIEQEVHRQKLVQIPVPNFTPEILLQVLYHKEKWVTREMQAFINLL